MSTSETSSTLPSQQLGEIDRLYSACISGSHILHYNGVLDAYGHLSFRHPVKADVFVMPRNMAPANISTSVDLVAYNVSDATAVEADAPSGYIERYIHSEIYKRYPAVNSVIHSHASPVLPYTISGVPMKPCVHMAGFLGKSTPIYDIAQHYQPRAPRDLLIRTSDLGKSFAESFAQGHAGSNLVEHSVVLMRGHGYTVAASNIQDCVFRAIYTKENAIIQTTSLGLRMAYSGTDDPNTGVQYLRDDELEGTVAMTQSSRDRAWGLWIREVEAVKLYVKE